MKATVCPNCNELNTLQQSVELEQEVIRKVEVGKSFSPDGVSVEFGKLTPAEDTVSESIIIGSGDIECRVCGETWHDEDDLRDGPAHEYRCEECGWWGSAKFQHGLERPQCSGVPADQGAFVG